MNTQNKSPELAVVAHPNLTTALKQSERLPDPLVFTSKWQELQLFLSQLKNKLTGNTNRYITDLITAVVQLLRRDINGLVETALGELALVKP